VTITTCYLFTDAEQDTSIIESILVTYKEKYDAFILDSQELNACLIPLLNDSHVERAPAQLADPDSIASNPPDIFITTTVEKDGAERVQYIERSKCPKQYVGMLHKTINQYAQKEGVMTSIVLFTAENTPPSLTKRATGNTPKVYNT